MDLLLISTGWRLILFVQPDQLSIIIRLIFFNEFLTFLHYVISFLKSYNFFNLNFTHAESQVLFSCVSLIYRFIIFDTVFFGNIL